MSALRSLYRSTWILLLGAAACGDAPTEPAALLMAAGTEAALDIAVDLPRLPKLVGGALAGSTADAPTRAGLELARTLWLDARSAGDDPAAASMRAAAYLQAATGLARTLDEPAVTAAHAALGRWIQLAGGLVGEGGPPEFALALGEARALTDRAAGALAAGDRAGAVHAMLEAADRLEPTTPQGVAARLIDTGETRLAEWRAAGEADPELRAARADRLLRGARSAVVAGETVLAVRRAAYAVQLLARD